MFQKGVKVSLASVGGIEAVMVRTVMFLTWRALPQDPGSALCNYISFITYIHCTISVHGIHYMISAIQIAVAV